MPFVFIIIGLALLIAGVNGTQGDLTNLVKGEFTGSPNFLSWMVAIFLIGSLGYIEQIKPISRIFLVLVIVVIFFKSDVGFFPQLITEIKKIKQYGLGPTTGTTQQQTAIK